jgi:hypothetical protein
MSGEEDLRALLDRVEHGEAGALERLRERVEQLHQRADRSERRAKLAEQRLDAWDRCYGRAHEVLDPSGDWAQRFSAEQGRPSARAERMAAALRVMGLPDVQQPPISDEARRFTGYVASGLAWPQALERTRAASQLESSETLRTALSGERERLGRWLTTPEGRPRDHDPDLRADRVRETVEILGLLAPGSSRSKPAGRGATPGPRRRPRDELH